MAKRTDGKTKLTPEVRQRLVEVAQQAGEWAGLARTLGVLGSLRT